MSIEGTANIRFERPNIMKRCFHFQLKGALK